jgi:selenocysteine-specific elongation factor
MLVARGDVVRRGTAFSLPGHAPRLAPLDEAHWARVRPLLEAAGTRPPRVRELAAELGLEPDAAEALLVRLEKFGLLSRVASNRFFPPDAVRELAEAAEALVAESEESAFTAAEFARRTGIGRNLTIQVVEYLDRIGVTKRQGELRRMARPAGDALG